jgi:hypothetical protein
MNQAETAMTLRNYFLSLLPVLVATAVSAQQPAKKNILYFEAGGTGLGLSINYERLVNNKSGPGWHLGVGLGGNKPSLVTGVKYLFGLGNHKSFLETGLGITLADRDYVGPLNYIQTEHNPYTPVFIPSAGYRHQTNYGLLWRVNYTPFFSKHRSEAGYAGLSLGWRF